MFVSMRSGLVGCKLLYCLYHCSLCVLVSLALIQTFSGCCLPCPLPVCFLACLFGGPRTLPHCRLNHTEEQGRLGSLLNTATNLVA